MYTKSQPKDKPGFRELLPVFEELLPVQLHIPGEFRPPDKDGMQASAAIGQGIALLQKNAGGESFRRLNILFSSGIIAYRPL